MGRRGANSLVVGTRASKLALWQTNFVVARLIELFPEIECRIETFKTIGDDIVDRPLPELGGKGVFTARLEGALLGGDVDIAVHSLKDLPIEMPRGLVVGAVPTRADARDILITANGVDVAGLPEGSAVGTSSLRRQAQLLARRPDLVMRPIRGNVETRLRKVMEGEYDATVLAAAGVDRLGLEVAEGGRLPFDSMLPAPGQGAMAVQCRAGDTRVLDLLARIDDENTRRATQAERAFLTGLGGGCAAPVAALARVEGGMIAMTGLVAQPDGTREVRVEGRGADAEALGRQLAEEAIAGGARDILEHSREALEKRLPLQRRRIVVTRAAEQADEICAALSGMGATAIRAPMIRTVAIADATMVERVAAQAQPDDWCVFTSANGVAAWCGVANGSGALACLEGLRVAAVGSKTAAALQRHSIEPDFVPSSFTGADAGREMPNIDGRNVWLLRAETAGSDIVDVLRGRGASVHDVAVYRTEPVAMEAATVEELRKGVDAILFTSGSTVRHFADACATHGLDIESFNNTVIACIGAVTEKTARELGFDVTVTPGEHTTSALVDAVADHFSEVRT